MNHSHNKEESFGSIVTQTDCLTIDAQDQKKHIQLLDGFEILHLIGKGGMGEVFRVREINLNRIVAMKIINEEIQHNQSSKNRFLREAQICAQLQHPNIIPIYKKGILPNGRLYFTMKEIKGLELTDKIKNFWNGNSNIGELQQLLQGFSQVCDAIAFAHDQGVIHRDLKPSNIMIGEYGEIQIVDWGIAKKEQPQDNNLNTTFSLESTKEGCVIGTPAFMSPEQASGEMNKIGASSDIYSLGCVLYNILTGETPFYDIEEKNHLKYIINKQPTPIKTVLSTKNRTLKLITDSLIQIANKAMSKEIKNRYQSSKEMSEDISLWLVNSQKREKACLLSEEGSKIHTKMREVDEERLEIDRKIQKSFFTNNFSDKTNLLWEEKERIESNLHFLYEQMIRKYNEALLIDQKVREVHEKIIQSTLLWNKNIIFSNMDSKNSKIMKRLQNHLSFLDTEQQEFWMDIFSSDFIEHYQLRYSNSINLVGREKERKQLLKLFHSKLPFCIVNGFAGVGTSHFVLDTLLEQKIRNKNIKLQIIDASQIDTLEELQSLFFQKNQHRVFTSSRNGHYKTTYPTFVLFDNVDIALKRIVEAIHTWSSKYTDTFFLITTRKSDAMYVNQTLTLQSLKVGEAVALFEKMAQNVLGRFKINKDNLDQILSIVNTLNRLPLAIRIAVSRLQSLSLRELEEHIQNPLPLIRNSSLKNQNSPLQCAMDQYWSSLNSNAQNILSQLSIFKGGFTLAAAEEIIKQEENQSSTTIIDLIDALVSDNLLYTKQIQDGSYRFYMLEFFAQYAKEKVILNLEQYEALQNRHCAYYAKMGREHVLLENVSSNLHNIPSELPNIKAAGLQNTSDGFDCSMTVLKIHLYNGPVSTALEYAEIIKKKKLSQIQTLIVDFNKARCNVAIGNLTQARKELAVCIPELQGFNDSEPHLLANCYLLLAEIEIKESNRQHSLELLQMSESIFQKIGSYLGLSKTYCLISKLYFTEGKTEQSYAYEKKALSVLNKASNFSTKYYEIMVLSNIHLAQGSYKRAITMYKHAITEIEKIGNRLQKGKTLANISTMYVNVGDYDKAMQYYKQALAIQQDFGDLHAIALTIGMAGRIYFHQRLYLKSMEHFKHCIKIAEENNFHMIQAIFKGNLGITYRKMNLLEKAKKELSFAIKVTSSLHPGACGAFQAEMALIDLEEERLDKAEERIHSAILLSKDLKSEHAKILCKSVFVHLRTNNLLLAQENLCEAQHLIRSFSILPESEVCVLYREAQAEIELYEEESM